jgi:hypothetical protein
MPLRRSLELRGFDHPTSRIRLVAVRSAPVPTYLRMPLREQIRAKQLDARSPDCFNPSARMI